MRRAAAKCLDAVVSTRHEMLPEFYKTVSPALIARFKEREENVKADVFHAYLSLLKQTRPVQSWLCDPDAMEQGETPLTMLQSQVSWHNFCFFDGPKRFVLYSLIPWSLELYSQNPYASTL